MSIRTMWRPSAVALLSSGIEFCLLTLASCGNPKSDNTQTSPSFVVGEVIAGLRTGRTFADLQNAGVDAAQEHLEAVEELMSGIVRLKLSVGADESVSSIEARTLGAIDALRAHPDFEYAHVNAYFRFSLTSDEYYGRQWNHVQINMPTAWDLSRSSSVSVPIAVLDTGSYKGHPDLPAERWLPGRDVSSQNEDDDATTQYKFAHGIHVAGIIGAKINNGIGVAGICENCQLLPVRISDDSGRIDSTNDAALVRGIQWVLNDGNPRARVINLSVNQPNTIHQSVSTQPDIRSCVNHPELQAAINRARNKGIIVVVSAGNAYLAKGSNGSILEDEPPRAPTAPADCDGVIAVAASDESGQLAKYSNRGPDDLGRLNIVAPGGGVNDETYNRVFGSQLGCGANYVFDINLDIGLDPGREQGVVSTWDLSNNTYCYRYMSGTSMAAPHVAGVVGLMLSVNPSLSPAEVEGILKATANPIQGCSKDQCGVGLLDAGKAVAAAAKIKGPCAYARVGEPCKFDTHSLATHPTKGFVEYITAYDRYWEFDITGNPLPGSGAHLRTVPRYASGPCSGVPADQPCIFDTRVLVDFPGIGFGESISAYGRYYNYDVNGIPYPATGNLDDVPRYAAGPCHAKPPGQPCVFDTRVLANVPVYGFGEGVNAYGNYYLWNLQGDPYNLGGTSLMTVPRYTAPGGPCTFAPSGERCVFDTETQATHPTKGFIQQLTAYGRVWEFPVAADGTIGPPTVNGADLRTFARYVE